MNKPRKIDRTKLKKVEIDSMRSFAEKLDVRLEVEKAQKEWQDRADLNLKRLRAKKVDRSEEYIGFTEDGKRLKVKDITQNVDGFLKKVEVPNPETIEAMKEPRGKSVTIEEVFKELDK